MSGTINLALSQQFDADGDPLSGGRLYFFAAGTTTPQSAYQDTALTIAHPNPLNLDASGRIPMFYLDDGNIKVRLEDENGLVIFAADSLLVIGPSGGGGGSSQVDATTVLQTGDMKIRFGTGILTGFVIANGTTIGNTGSGAGQLADPAAEALFKYLHTTPLAMLTSGGAAATKTTPTADWTGNNRMTLPDLRGRTIAGLDDMGTAAAGRLTATYWGGGASPTVLGNAGGDEKRALIAANMVAHMHDVGTLAAVSVGDHTHTGTTASDGAHTHTINITNNTLGGIATPPLSGSVTVSDNPSNQQQRRPHPHLHDRCSRRPHSYDFRLNRQQHRHQHVIRDRVAVARPDDIRQIVKSETSMPFYTGHIAAVSNRADLLFGVELKHPATNDFVDFTDATITVSLRLTSQSNPSLTGTNTDGHVTVTGPGTFDVHFTRAEMTTLPPGDADMGITVVLDGLTYQVFAGQIPIVDGVVAA